jgi:hypothetical protein
VSRIDKRPSYVPQCCEVTFLLNRSTLAVIAKLIRHRQVFGIIILSDGAMPVQLM